MVEAATNRKGKSDDSHQQRPRRMGGRSLAHYQSLTGSLDEDSLADLLGDLHHWCDRENDNFQSALDRARQHYDAESSTPSITPYMATFNTPAGWITEIFRTSSPTIALKAALNYIEHPNFSAEDLEPIPEGYSVREIIITDPDDRHHQHAVWRTDEYRVQLAAPNLLEALEDVMHWWKSTAHTDDDEMPAELFDRAHAAIAQGKGGAA